MPGAMRKLGLYLGLVEDDENDGYDDYPEDHYDEPVVRRHVAAPAAAPRRSFDTSARSEGAVALDTARRPAPVPAYDEGYRITTLHPHSYNDARPIGEHFREGTPVIMNLSEMDDSDAKRLVDFAAGLAFALRGSFDKVATKVFLLSPADVDVTPDDRRRIAETGFYAYQ